MADEENNEPKKKGFILRILIFVVAGLVLIGAGLGGGYILFGGSQPDPLSLIHISEPTRPY